MDAIAFTIVQLSCDLVVRLESLFPAVIGLLI